MNFQKNSIKLITCILLVVLSKITMAQIHVINADSIKLGEVAGTNGIAFYGRPYLKNIGLGKVSDSILVRQSDGQIKFVPRSLIFSGVVVDWANVSGRPASLSQFNNDSGFITSAGSVNYATTSGSANSVAWGNVLDRPGYLSQFINDAGYITSAGSVNYATTSGSANSVAWGNVSGRPSVVSSFTNDAGYVTASGNVNYANSSGVANSVLWGNVSGRPSTVSSFSNDSGYLTASGSINYSNSSGVAGSTQNFMSTSHPGTYFLVNNWDGTRWNITSNHGSPVRVGFSDAAGSVAWSDVSGKPSAVSSFSNDAGYITSGGSVNWANVSGRPSYVSSFINDAGYVTAGGNVNYANSAGSVSWANVSGKPSNVSSFINDAGYLTAGGSINYANSSGSASTAGSTTNFMSTSHAGSFFLVNNWDGARWNVTSNHGAPVRVGWADGAATVDWSGITNKPNFAAPGGAISQFDNDYGYIRWQDISLASVTNNGSHTPHNLYLYKGMSDAPNEGSGIMFNSEEGGNPAQSSMWQLGDGGAMINKSSTYGWWETNFRIEAGGDAYLRGWLTEGSDSRLKKNINQITGVSSSLRAVQAVEYDRTDSKSHHLGFIAQDFQKIFPSLVTQTGGTKDMLGIAYSNFTVPLLKGWQEHDGIISEQLTKVKALEDELTIIKSELKGLKEELKQIKDLLKPIIK